MEDIKVQLLEQLAEQHDVSKPRAIGNSPGFRCHYKLRVWSLGGTGHVGAESDLLVSSSL